MSIGIRPATKASWTNAIISAQREKTRKVNRIKGLFALIWIEAADGETRDSYQDASCKTSTVRRDGRESNTGCRYSQRRGTKHVNRTGVLARLSTRCRTSEVLVEGAAG